MIHNIMDGDHHHQCIDHPHNTSASGGGGGGICAFCLQDKLAKLLVSSSSPPSFRSNTNYNTTHATSSASSITVPTASASAPSFAPASSSVPPKKNGSDHHHQQYYKRSLLPFLLAKQNKNKPSNTSQSSSSSCDTVLKRSKSITATPTRNGFWSFLYLSSKPSKKLLADGNKGFFRDISSNTSSAPPSNTTPEVVSIRSRSVGCGGSRRFSGGDCSSRAESQSQPQHGGDGVRVRSWAFASPMRAFSITKASSSSSSSSKNDEATTPNLSAISPTTVTA